MSYNYSLHLAPDWYRDLYFRHLRQVEGRSEEALYSLARRESRDPTRPLRVPPPDRGDGSRFVGCGVCGEHVGMDCFSVRCEGGTLDRGDVGQGCGLWHHVECLSKSDRQDILQAVEEEKKNGGARTMLTYAWKCQKCS